MKSTSLGRYSAGKKLEVNSQGVEARLLEDLLSPRAVTWVDKEMVVMWESTRS